MHPPPGDYPSAYPPVYVPVSGWAVTALVLAIVLAFPSFLGVYWPEALPLVIVVLSWGPIASRQRRGTGLAIAAAVIALLGALAGFGVARAFTATMREKFAPLYQIAQAGDVEGAGRWLIPADADKAAARADLWKRRFAAAVERYGAWSGEIEAGSFLTGISALLIPPNGVEELEPRGGDPVTIGQAVWLRLPFAKATIWTAVQGDPKAPQGQGFSDLFKKVLDKDSRREDGKGQDLPHAVHDLRFYVPTDSGPAPTPAPKDGAPMPKEGTPVPKETGPK